VTSQLSNTEPYLSARARICRQRRGRRMLRLVGPLAVGHRGCVWWKYAHRNPWCFVVREAPKPRGDRVRIWRSFSPGAAFRTSRAASGESGLAVRKFTNCLWPRNAGVQTEERMARTGRSGSPSSRLSSATAPFVHGPPHRRRARGQPSRAGQTVAAPKAVRSSPGRGGRGSAWRRSVRR